MSRAYFEERQSFRQVRWVWFITVPFLLLTVLAIVDRLYRQLAKGIPVGNEPMSDSGLIIFSLVTFFIVGFVVWVLLSVKLETRIDESGIRYRFFPHMFTSKTIAKDSIQSYEIVDENILKRGGVGFKLRIFGTPKALTIKGNTLIRITLKDNTVLKIGTQDRDGAERAMTKMMETDKTS